VNISFCDPRSQGVVAFIAQFESKTGIYNRGFGLVNSLFQVHYWKCLVAVFSSQGMLAPTVSSTEMLQIIIPGSS
jgi:hypothetical protein